MLDDTVHEVGAKYKDQLTPLVTQSFSLNKLIEGRIRVVKTDGVTFYLLKASCSMSYPCPKGKVETIVCSSWISSLMGST